MDILRAAGHASTQLQSSLLYPESARLASSSLESCLNSIDCFGRSLAIDDAYRHLNSGEQYLLDAQKMQDTAPHTDVAESALRAIDRAKDWIRPYAVAPDSASCRDPPVCVVDTAGKKLSEIDPNCLLVLPQFSNKPDNPINKLLFI